jgi:hypothetical protein
MSKMQPDARQLASLQAQLGILEQMLRPVVGGPQGTPPINGPAARPPPQNAMQQQLMENMLGGVDPQRAAQIRSLMAVANKPNVGPLEMETAIAPLMAELAPQDQATVRMMVSMMQQPPTMAATSELPPQTTAVVAAPQPAAVTPDVQHMFDLANARAAAALEEARRVAAELVAIKDTQNQVAAAMYQQTQVMRDMIKMLKTPTPEPAVDEVEPPGSQNATA